MDKLKWVDCPCKDCKNRHDGCHDKCEEYVKFTQFRESLRAKKWAEFEKRNARGLLWN